MGPQAFGRGLTGAGVVLPPVSAAPFSLPSLGGLSGFGLFSLEGAGLEEGSGFGFTYVGGGGATGTCGSVAGAPGGGGVGVVGWGGGGGVGVGAPGFGAEGAPPTTIAAMAVLTRPISRAPGRPATHRGSGS